MFWVLRNLGAHMLRILTLVALLASSAVTHAADSELPYKEFLKRNAVGVSQLAVGMTKEQVAAIMKTYTTSVHDAVLTNPHKTEVIQRGSDHFEVLYYITRRHPPFTPITDSQTVPVVLKNNAVVGWGKTALQDLRRQ